MAKRILSSKQPHPQASVGGHAGPSSSANWRPSSNHRGTSRIAPLSSSRSEANLGDLRSAEAVGHHHPSLEHFANGSNHLTMLKTKVWYHSQRSVQEASVWKFILYFIAQTKYIPDFYIPKKRVISYANLGVILDLRIHFVPRHVQPISMICQGSHLPARRCHHQSKRDPKNPFCIFSYKAYSAAGEKVHRNVFFVQRKYRLWKLSIVSNGGWVSWAAIYGK